MDAHSKMCNIDALGMVEHYLRTKGYDGLYLPEECACKVGDLAPCSAYFGGCMPGYLQKEDSEEGFIIGPTRPQNE